MKRTPFQRSYGTHTHTQTQKLKTTVGFFLHFWCHEIYKTHFGETQPSANVYYSAPGWIRILEFYEMYTNIF